MRKSAVLFSSRDRSMLNVHRMCDIVKSTSFSRTMSSDVISLKQIFLQCVKSVQPDALIKSQVEMRGRHLCVRGQSFALDKACYMVGFGKAVLGMALEMEMLLGNNLQNAVVNVPKGIFADKADLLHKTKIEFIEGAENNLPDDAAMWGARKIKNLAEGLKEDDLLLVLISGGGSALLPLPKPPVTLPEKLSLIRQLSRRGADINELNTVRKQLSLLKGGGLARVAYPCRVVSLILSDVVGDPLDVIASGPTVPTQTIAQDAYMILEKYSLYATTSDRVKSALKEANQFGGPVTLSANGKFPHVANFIVGNNGIAADAAEKTAAKLGFQAVVVSTRVEGTVDYVSDTYVKFARLVADVGVRREDLARFLSEFPWPLEEDAAKMVMGMDFSKKMAFIFAGEPTVVVTGSGTGGRNQQLALALSIGLNNQEIKTADVSFLSGGTDGIDGPTDAAGAVGYASLVSDCSRLNINPRDYLVNNDSYGFYSRFKDGRFLVKVGHTGTNVMDVHILTVTPKI